MELPLGPPKPPDGVYHFPGDKHYTVKGKTVVNRHGFPAWKSNALAMIISNKTIYPVCEFVVEFKDGEQRVTHFDIYMKGESVVVPGFFSSDSQVVHFSFVVHGYGFGGGPHASHALAATVVRAKNRLFFLNPWGRASMVDKSRASTSTQAGKSVSAGNNSKRADTNRENKDAFLIRLGISTSLEHFGIVIHPTTNTVMAYKGFHVPPVFQYRGNDLQARNENEAGGGVCAGYTGMFLTDKDIQAAITTDVFPINNGKIILNNQNELSNDEKLRDLIASRLARKPCDILKHYYEGPNDFNNDFAVRMQSMFPPQQTRPQPHHPLRKKKPPRPVTPRTSEKSGNVTEAFKQRGTKITYNNVEFVPQKVSEQLIPYRVKRCVVPFICLEELLKISNTTKNKIGTMVFKNVEMLTCIMGKRYVRRHDVVIKNINYVFFHAGNVNTPSDSDPRIYIPTHVGGLGIVEKRRNTPTVKNFQSLPEFDNYLTLSTPSRPLSKRRPDSAPPRRGGVGKPRTIGGLAGSYNLYKKKNNLKAPGS